ncbi:ATP-grasp ribosomal peptide maturase [Sphaerisporangium viridialbum]|uniref:ATP-grasp ribosomal peptide maturase n=1 Tax=Sphaerisporangium viridialbum TaxID=46189 RepID=UPI003C78F4E7
MTSVDDATADLVTQRLYDRGVPVVRLDPGDFLTCGSELRMSARLDDTGLAGVIITPSRELNLRHVRAAWWRRPSPYRAPPHWPTQDATFAVGEARFGFSGVLTALHDCLWINHPWRNHAAEYKPGQLVTAAECGFALAPTLITNDPFEARAFAETYSPIVYKPLRQSIQKDQDGVNGMIWVRPVDPAELDDAVAGTAHMFQAEVEKVADVRVTVVGHRLFAVRIDSGLIDWRADYETLTYTLIPCPPAVESSIRQYMSSYGLVFAAFDFALTPSGGWIFLECNPNGQWAWIAEQEQAVADALTDLLERGRL